MDQEIPLNLYAFTLFLNCTNKINSNTWNKAIYGETMASLVLSKVSVY
jgi:hypothetical protein